MSLDGPILSTLVLETLVKSILLLSAALILVRLIRRSSAAARHLLLASAAASLLILPIASALMPSWNVLPVPRLLPLYGGQPEPPGDTLTPQDPAGSGTPSTPGARPAEQGTEQSHGAGSPGSLSRAAEAAMPPPGSVGGFRWIAGLLLVWGAGASLLLLRLLGGKAYGYGIVRAAPAVENDHLLGRIDAISRRFGITHPIPVVESDHLKVPFVCGLLRFRLIMPPRAGEWSGECIEAVVRHELAHIKRRDTLVQLLAQVACCLYWLNPLVWMMERTLFVERERACDDMAITRDIKASSYAEHLMEVMEEMGNTGIRAWVVSAMAEGTDFKDRIISVLDPAARRNAPKKAHVAAVAGISILVVLALSSIHPSITAAAGSEPPSGDVVEARGPSRTAVSEPGDRVALRERRIVEADTRQTDAFIALLDNPDPDVREHAAEALGHSGSERAVPALIQALGDDNPSVREHVASALGQIGDKRAVQPLIDVVRSDRSARVREHAASALGMFGDDDDSYRMLVDLYESDPDLSVRGHAAYGLGLMRAQRAFDLLVDGLESAHPVIRLHCAEALGFLGDLRAQVHLEKALDDVDSDVRRAASRALRRIRRNL